MNAIEEVFQLSRAMFVVALLATVPGYWATVFLIDKIGRYRIQLVGFLVMCVCMWFLGHNYRDYRGEESKCKKNSNYDYCDGNLVMFAILFGLTLFFANFGPNSTTFIVPAELFPARLRSTCHGISAAAGKSGAIL
ncbi:inorganic phosphate transporter 1-11-like, partial [Trifolium medium]|nr:inorganic phosphate transporter 1-11-like [Trifolium medium]